MKRFTAAILAACLVALGGVIALASSPAVATSNGGDAGCTWQWTRSVPQSHTEYHFAKFTRTKTREWVPGTPAIPGTPAVYGPDLWWNWSPNDTQGPQDYVPAFPSDDRGTWQGPHENGGPMQDTYGTFQTGGGNSPFFHREHGALITPATDGTPAVPGHWSDWSDWGPWTKWSPETHTSWQTSTDPLGVPEFHAQGLTWYREWQARFDGQTRTVQDAPLSQGPIRSASEPDRGAYPDVAWVKDGESIECPADHDWQYDVSCTAVSGSNPNYGDSVDSNVRIKNLATGETQTFNYHGPDNGSGGAFSYEYADEYGVPASWTYYEVQWVQVNGTNYHWEGSLTCGEPDDEVVPFPTPQVNDPCGEGNATWVKPEDTDAVHWVITEDGRLIGTTQDGYTWPNGETVNSWGQAPETNTEACTTVIDVPAAPETTDECGPGNIAFVLPGDTDTIAWTLDEDGNAVATVVAEHTTFPGGATSHTFTLPEEENTEPCPVLIPVPQAPGQNDLCNPEGVTDNVQWDSIPADTETVDWTLNEDGSLTAEPIAPAYFEGEAQSVTYTLDEDSGVDCPRVIETVPSVTTVDECGVANDSGPTWAENPGQYVGEVVGNTVVFTAVAPYVFAEGLETTVPFTPTTGSADDVCEKPQGYEHNTSDSECVNGDLVTTETTLTGTPVQAEDGSWSIEETGTSSQSIQQDARKCADEPNPPSNPDNPNPPSSHLTSLPMTGREAGTTVTTTQQSPLALYGGVAAMLAGLVGLSLTLRRRSA